MANRHPIPSLATELEREWNELTNRVELAQIARSWALTAVPPRTLDDVLTATGYRPAPR